SYSLLLSFPTRRSADLVDVVGRGQAGGDGRGEFSGNSGDDGAWIGHAPTLGVPPTLPDDGRQSLHAQGSAYLALSPNEVGGRGRSEEHTSELQSREKLV